MYIGNYTAEQWHSDSVKPYHHEIIQARSNDEGGSNTNNNNSNSGNHQSNSHKRRVKAIKRNKNKLKKLNKKIEAAKTELESFTGKSGNTAKVAKVIQFEEQNAGDAFGGKKDKKGKKE